MKRLKQPEQPPETVVVTDIDTRITKLPNSKIQEVSVSVTEKMPPSSQDYIDAYAGRWLPKDSGPGTTISVALYGTVKGPDWRQTFTSTPVLKRPIVYFDPRVSYGPGPEHYLSELQHFHDDIRVVVVNDQSNGFNSLLEMAHILEVELDTAPLVAYVAPHIAEDVASTGQDNSNYWRSYMLDELDREQDNPNLHIAGSVDEALLITQALIMQLQPVTA